jgi:hypothetical protein
MKDFKNFYEANEFDDSFIDEDEVLEEAQLCNKMFDFIMALDEDNVPDDLVDEYIEIIEIVAGDEEEDLAEAALKIKTDKGDVTLKANDSIEHEAKPGVVRIGMAGDVIKSGVKFKKGGKWYVAESIEINEAPPAKRVRRDPVKRRKAAREFRKVKAKKKIEGRRTRKTAKFKRFKKKQKRLGKRGKTATGKRKRTFINK